MLIERAGRRILLAASSLLVSLSMAGLATYLTLLASIPPGLKWLPLLLAGLNIRPKLQKKNRQPKLKIDEK